uniref:Arylacetamide deacetylase-like 4 n=1 Tax=Erpetoichthys calabaricus TaxID=27687 RepID=A0A8C4S678_ERPCA
TGSQRHVLTVTLISQSRPFQLCPHWLGHLAAPSLLKSSSAAEASLKELQHGDVHCHRFALRCFSAFGSYPAVFRSSLQRDDQLGDPAGSVARQQAALHPRGEHRDRNLDSYDHICRYVAIHSETVVVSVAYRLSPEHRYPVQLDDCQAATLHFLKVAEADYGVDPRKVALGGDSAGGNLAAALCYRAAKEGARPQPCAQILIYPLLQMADFHLPSYQQNKMVPMLFRGRTIFYCLQYLNGDMTLNEEMLNSDHVPVELKLRYRKWLGHENLPSECKARGFSLKVASSHDEEVYDLLKQALEPELSPLLAPDDVVRKLPPAFILTCEYDVLRDDGILFKKRLEDLGVPVTWHHINDGFHGILNFFDGGRLNFPSGKRAIDHVVDFLRTL